jgi:hypothetical protein
MVEENLVFGWKGVKDSSEVAKYLISRRKGSIHGRVEPRHFVRGVKIGFCDEKGFVISAPTGVLFP